MISIDSENNRYPVTASVLLAAAGIALSMQPVAEALLKMSGMYTGRELNIEFWGYGLAYTGPLLVITGLMASWYHYSHNKSLVLKASLASLCLYFYFSLFNHSVNIPVTDDFRSILGFTNEFLYTQNISEKLELLTSFHTESRFITLRFMVLMSWFITGEVNIRLIILTASLSLMVIIWLFHQNTNTSPQRRYITLTSAILLLHFGYYDALVWATNTVAYLITALMIITTLHLVQQSKKSSQLLAVLTALIAAVTFGNGLLVFPLVILSYLVRNNFRQAFAWLVFSSVMIYVYLSGSPNMNSTGFHPLADYLIYGLSFTGSAFQFLYRMELTVLAGVMMWVVFIWLTITKYFRKNFVIYGVLLFVILSSIIAAHYRLQMGVYESVSIRYSFFSLLAVISTLIAIYENLSVRKREKSCKAILVSAVVYHLLSGIFFFPEVPIRNVKLKMFISDIKNNNAFREIHPVVTEGADKIVKESMEKKIYFP